MASVYDEDQKKREAQQYQQTVQGAQNLSYQPSQAAANARQYLDTLTQNKPGAYMSRYGGQMESLLSQIQGRQPFRYDARTDPLYQVYRDMYLSDGRRAMQDTMGQAAALTGGYGNSYAQSVGQQQYNQYMERLHGMLPQFQQQAYQQYQGEGDALAQNYALLAQADQAEYGRFRDAVKDMMAAGVGGSGGGGGGGAGNTSAAVPNANTTDYSNIIDFIKYVPSQKEYEQRGTGTDYPGYVNDKIESFERDGRLTGDEAAVARNYYAQLTQKDILREEINRMYKQNPAGKTQIKPSEDELAAWLNMKKK